MAKVKKRKQKKLTDKEKEQRQQKNEIRRLLRNIGFNRAPGIAGKEFVYNGRTSEIDDVFYYENVLLLIEYTTLKPPGDHLLKKKLIFDKINNCPADFIEYLLNEKIFEGFEKHFRCSSLNNYSPNQLQIVIIYCSAYSISKEHKCQFDDVCFFDYPTVKYFESISKVIKKSSRFEFFKFLNIEYDNIGDRILQGTTGSKEKFSGHILPEEHSSFKEGYKIISFYIDADSLLKRAYVLRKEGWKRSDTIGLYQRMFDIRKIKSMRKYLHNSGRVFVNNIITVLPIDKIKLYDAAKKEIEIDEKGNFLNKPITTKVQLTNIEIDNEINIVGIIDGQHRVYAYHEGNDKYESEIERLRKIQNLLVTGILYPKNANETERLKFEAKLFLEINANQTSAKSQLRQEIEFMIHPFSSTAIAKSIVNSLNESGPLENLFEQHFYEKERLKTASIISYGLKPLVKLKGQDSLYKTWQEPRKSELQKKEDSELLDTYCKYCVNEIRKIFIGFKANVERKSWATERSDPNGILRVTAVNGIINCLRIIIENDNSRKVEFYKQKLKGIEEFPFRDYKSSHYRRMGADIYQQYFGIKESE